MENKLSIDTKIVPLRKEVIDKISKKDTILEVKENGEIWYNGSYLNYILKRCEDRKFIVNDEGLTIDFMDAESFLRKQGYIFGYLKLL